MSVKKARRDSKNQISFFHHFLKPFLITFCLVTAAGIAGAAAYRWVTEPAGTEDKISFEPVDEWTPINGLSAKEEEQTGADGETDGAGEDAADPGKYGDILKDPEYMAENNIYAIEAADPDRVTIAFAGDILFDERYGIMTRVGKSGSIEDGIDSALIAEMQGADIMMINNEFPYSDRGQPLEEKQFTFRAKPSSVSYLNDLGVDIVSLANNHAYDYGEDALLDTMDILKDAGIAYVGAGHDLAEARRPVCYIVNDMKIAVISATQIERLDNPDTKGATETSAGVFRSWDGADLIETVQEAKADNDFVIVYLHWGTENEADIDWAQEKQAAEVTQAGADLVIGDHPHCLQPISVVNGVPVVYSLGNFWFNSKTLDTGMIKAVLDENGLQDLQFAACEQSGSRTRLLYGEEKKRVLDYMQSISGGVHIDEDGHVTW